MPHPIATDRLGRIESARRAVMLNRAETSPTGVQPWISSSWKRCLALGHKPDSPVGFDMVSSAMQRHALQANQLLARAARTTLQELAAAIAQTRYFAILTDANGTVLDADGEINRSDRRASLITRIGVNLSEAAVGTTAIGATLAEQRSIWLHRGEHFFNDTHCYSCAGAPIFAPDGRCIGMLDVTGIDVPERPELVHLVSAASHRIENALLLAQPHALVVHLQWPGQLSGKDTEGLVCLDADGGICGLNMQARHMLGLAGQAGQPAHACDVFAMPWAHLFDVKHQILPLTVPLWSGLHVQMRSSLAGKLSPRAARSATGALGLGQRLKDHETSLIHDTVGELKGNVAAAAKKLGISRATVYRKLGQKKPEI